MSYMLYSSTKSRGMASKPTPFSKCSSISSDFFWVTFLLLQDSAKDNAIFAPLDKRYSPVIVSYKSPSYLKPHSYNQVKSYLILWAMSKSVLSNSSCSCLNDSLLGAVFSSSWLNHTTLGFSTLSVTSA